MSKVLSIRLDDAEHAALAARAEAAQMAISEYALGLLRLGVVEEERDALADVAEERRIFEREEQRTLLRLVAQNALAMRLLAESSGIDVAAVVEKARDFAADAMADCDTFDALLNQNRADTEARMLA